ncbi:MAG TPA: nuclear transport factor 2 family protein [Bryobacteraceae bacterium]|nr:nuclear transport factor 2 family protein [Bryobacteraceae bacterium]
MQSRLVLSRRKALSAAGAGLAWLGSTRGARAADWTPAERANVQVVNDFCAAWPSHDLQKVTSFFADDGAYRMSERQEPAKGRQAVTEKIHSFLANVVRFEVLETFARGPMVFNERIDHFQNLNLKSWHGVGVFFLRDGKIVEWYDYTIASERA